MSVVKKLIPALLIALGLLAIGVGIRSGFRSMSSAQRTVSVRGLSEREVKADKVTWPIVYQIQGNILPDLYDQTSTTNDKILAFLHNAGITDSEISINAPEAYDRASNNYSDNNYKFRYNISEVIVVTSSQVDKVDELIRQQGQLLKEGIALSANDYNYPIQYEFTGLNDIKPQMIAEATKNAREAAQKFADDSESKLGKIQTANQGQFSIENRDQFTPSIKNVRVVTTLTYFLED
ncbi:MAG: hypothetical protein BHV69_11015 [Bacteroidales bacterium 52_46]|nr:MAG: hypothetical protein BHV69_11015 [Bacteroidales bacterium 52_46]